MLCYYLRFLESLLVNAYLLVYYGLDPNFSHHFSSPVLSRDAMLKMTGIELELISGNDMHFFIEKGMRGGIYC